MPSGKSQSAGQPCIGRTSAIHHGIVSASGVAAFFGGIVVAAIQFAGAMLTSALPRVDVVEFEKLGHMGPIIHSDPLNEVIPNSLEQS